MLTQIRPYTNHFLSNAPRHAYACLRLNSTKSDPPKFFSEFYDPSAVTTVTPSQKIIPQTTQTTPKVHQTTSSQSSSSIPIKDLTLVLATLFLSYFAVDNYGRRLELEKAVQEQQLKFLKNLSVQQNTFNQARKKKDIQLITERKKMQTREMKMVYHIALLREQLIKQGLEPIEIAKALEEFEKEVKMENSLSNVSSMALWVVDDSELKKFVPSIHEYENKK